MEIKKELTTKDIRYIVQALYVLRNEEYPAYEDNREFLELQAFFDRRLEGGSGIKLR